MAEGYEPKPYSPIGFYNKNFQDSTTAVAPGGGWYTVNCAVSGKKLVGIAGFGVDYPNVMDITNISIISDTSVRLYIMNTSNANVTGFNFTGLYVNSREV